MESIGTLHSLYWLLGFIAIVESTSFPCPFNPTDLLLLPAAPPDRRPPSADMLLWIYPILGILASP